MTPSQAIAALDRQLARHGQTVILRTSAGVVTSTVRAMMRGYQPDELVGGIVQGDSKVILSPTGLNVLPVLNSKVVHDGRVRNVQAVESVKLDDVLVRVNVQVRG